MTDEEYEEFQKEVAATIAESERLAQVHQETFAKAYELNAALTEVCRRLELFDPDPDTPLTLAEALCLPELGGILYRNTPSQPSPTVKLKTLYKAIERGRLVITRLNDKDFHVTRRQIKEWIARCQESSKTPISSSAVPVTTKQLASSPTKELGLSSMETSKLRQDAVSQMLRKLR